MTTYEVMDRPGADDTESALTTKRRPLAASAMKIKGLDSVNYRGRGWDRCVNSGAGDEAVAIVSDKSSNAQDPVLVAGAAASKRKRARRARSGRVADPTKQMQLRTAEDIANEQTVEQLALRIWAAMVAQKVLTGMSDLMNELLESRSLDDDDEEGNDEEWLDNHRKREKRLLDEAILDGLDEYSDFNAINNLPPNSDPDIARNAEQLKSVLAKCAIGATELKEKFARAQLERMVRRDLVLRFKADPKYSQHLREDVPGSDVKKNGARRRTSSRGSFFKTSSYEAGGGLAALLTGGWLRVAKDRIDFAAWSHQYGAPRKSERQSWRLHFIITERDGRRSLHEIPREALAGAGASAIKSLMRAGIHVVAEKPLVGFLRFKPKREIVRMPQVGFFEVDGHYIFVRSNETLLLPALRELKDHLVYEADNAGDPDQYGHQIKGTTADWQRTVAIPLRGNSNVALTLATSFASALIPFADEQRGGVHLFGVTGIGKTAILAIGESVYGLPGASEHPRAYGRSWAVTPTGLEDLLRFRNHAGFFLDELQRVPRENRGAVVQMIYAFTQVQKARGGSWRLRRDGAGQVFLLSSGEDPIAAFVGKGEDREGRERRLPDIPAQIQSGSAFETIDRDALLEKLPALYAAIIKQCHGAPGRDWQMWLVELGAVKIKERIDRERQEFLALPQVQKIEGRAQPQLRSIIRRFALYAASLHLAIEANVLPWTVAEADAGLIACLERWVNQRGNTDPATTRSRFVADLMRKLADDLSDRFIRISKVKGRFVPATDSDIAKQQKSLEVYDGYVKNGLVLIRPEAWVRRCAGADHVEIARHLHAKGVLLASDKDGKFSKTEQTIGRSERFYVVRRTALTLPDTSDTPDPEK